MVHREDKKNGNVDFNYWSNSASFIGNPKIPSDGNIFGFEVWILVAQ